MSSSLSQVQGLLEQMGKELQCPICLCIMTDPHGLPCMHHFCWECLKKALHERRECPVCTLPAIPRAMGRNRNLRAICEAFESVCAAVDDAVRENKKLLADTPQERGSATTSKKTGVGSGRTREEKERMFWEEREREDY
jgi:hypothetical protein